MWMQILAAAGIEVIGERRPQHWSEHLTAANPDGFYESELVAGIYFRTNPHPISGAFLFPDQTMHHAVKVFIPGLIRTDLAFIDRVIATMRPWRAFARSRARLQALTRAAAGAEGEEGEDGEVVTTLAPGLEWWSENFALVRDVATRRYAVHMQSYESLLADPEGAIQAVLGWVGAGDARRACAVVRRERLGQPEEGEVDTSGLEPRHMAAMDELYEHIHVGRALSQTLVDQLNQVDRELRPRLVEHNAAVKAAAMAALAARKD